MDFFSLIMTQIAGFKRGLDFFNIPAGPGHETANVKRETMPIFEFFPLMAAPIDYRHV